jgi:hypothetical protein
MADALRPADKVPADKVWDKVCDKVEAHEQNPAAMILSFLRSVTIMILLSPKRIAPHKEPRRP